jgi:hypothetical protein
MFADVVPILIGRRIPFVTFRAFFASGVIVHETFNQLYPYADADLAAQVSDKTLLGFHDIRVGNEPDNRLLRFIQTHLANLITEARRKFSANRSVLEAFASSNIALPALINESRANLGLEREEPEPDDDLQDS